jgi:hypothetical protein
VPAGDRHRPGFSIGPAQQVGRAFGQSLGALNWRNPRSLLAVVGFAWDLVTSKLGHGRLFHKHLDDVERAIGQ